VRKALTIILLGFHLLSHAQERFQVEMFCGAEMNFVEMNWHNFYDMYLRLTPGMKFHLGHHWMLAGQVHVPLINKGYVDSYSMFRLSNATLSKELHFPDAHQYFKLSAGLFSKDRCGFDLRWMVPITDWWMLSAQAGVTNYWALGYKPGGLKENEFCSDNWLFTGMLNTHFLIKPWNMEIRMNGGRYIDGLMGAELDVMGHYRHVSFVAYARLHEPVNDRFQDHVITGAITAGEGRRQSGGFKIIVMLPPYKKSKRTFVVRPASNIRLIYNAQMDEKTMMMYETDPEENERVYPVAVPWGLSTQQPAEK
jgi:hypothetical protein